MSQTLSSTDRPFVGIRSMLGQYSVDEVIIASGSGSVGPNTVLGTIAASGKYGPFDATASDGLETATAVLIHGVDATSSDAPGVAVVRIAELEASQLVWGDNDPAGIDSGIGDLNAIGLIVRT